MIEVFKTNVCDYYQAKLLVQIIHKRFGGYRANFDLHDCDRILRIVSHGNVNARAIIELLCSYGFICDVLPDDICAPSTGERQISSKH
jgi:hypothetical protein